MIPSNYSAIATRFPRPASIRSVRTHLSRRHQLGGSRRSRILPWIEFKVCSAYTRTLRIPIFTTDVESRRALEHRSACFPFQSASCIYSLPAAATACLYPMDRSHCVPSTVLARHVWCQLHTFNLLLSMGSAIPSTG